MCFKPKEKKPGEVFQALSKWKDNFKKTVG